MSNRPDGERCGYSPSQHDIDDLIRRADEHTLGADFLRNGALDAVAATFGVHAFLVDAARARLAEREVSSPR